MLYQCDALLPREDRYLSEKYRILSRYMHPFRVPAAYLHELAILLNTPGFYRTHVAVMLQWDRNVLTNHGNRIADAYPTAEYLPKQLASITLPDGRAILEAMLDAKPRYGHTVPLYVTRYLQHERDRGMTAAMLAQRHNTTKDKIIRWWNADLFDPLTALPRPQHLLHKHKPLPRIRRVV